MHCRSLLFRSRGLALAALVCCLALSSGAVAGTGIIFVDDDAPPGGDGQSWATSYRFLQDALEHARDPASGVHEIRIARGVYFPDRNAANPGGTGDQDAVFELVSDVALIGGFAGLGAAMPDERDADAFSTILTGDLAGDDSPLFVNVEENSEVIVRAEQTGPATTLDGLTVAHAFKGSAVYVFQGSLQLIDCLLERNLGSDGAALLLLSEADAIVQSCEIRFNVGRHVPFGFGGAIAAFFSKCLTIRDSVIRDSLTGPGEDGFNLGGVAVQMTELRMEDCLVLRNLGKHVGGVAIRPGSDAQIVRTVFEGNSARPDSGVLGISDELPFFPSRVYLEDCVFVGNERGMAIESRLSSPVIALNRCTVIQDGTALSLGRSITTASNCLIVGSEAVLRQDASVFSSDDPSVDLFNCTLVGTDSNPSVAPVHLSEKATINNTIVWSASPEALFSIRPELVHIDSSLVRGGWDGPGVDILDADPRFVRPIPPDGDVATPEAYDYRLSASSPALDVGDNTLLVTCGVDLDGNDRISNALGGGGPRGLARKLAIVDLGAYERPGKFDDEDCDGDGVDDACALALGLAFDCNHNGVVDLCETGTGNIRDCNDNLIPDACELTEFDCDENGVPDDCDIARGRSNDCDANGVPDECQTDCNANGLPDTCDLDAGTSGDCNANAIPDECEEDCNQQTPCPMSASSCPSTRRRIDSRPSPGASRMNSRFQTRRSRCRRWRFTSRRWGTWAAASDRSPCV